MKPFDSVVDSPADERVAGGLALHYGVCGVCKEADVFRIEVGAFVHVEFVREFFFKGSIFRQDEVFGGAIHAIYKVNFALHEEEKFGGLTVYE